VILNRKKIQGLPWGVSQKWHGAARDYFEQRVEASC